MDIDAQGTGVASELVRSAESRLAAAGLKQVQIEYEYTCGDAHSQRLHNWYEGVLGFSGGSTPTTRSGCTEWRRCRKPLSVTMAAVSQPTEDHPAMRAMDVRRVAKAEPTHGCSACLKRLWRRLCR